MEDAYYHTDQIRSIAYGEHDSDKPISPFLLAETLGTMQDEYSRFGIAYQECNRNLDAQLFLESFPVVSFAYMTMILAALATLSAMLRLRRYTRVFQMLYRVVIRGEVSAPLYSNTDLVRIMLYTNLWVRLFLVVRRISAPHGMFDYHPGHRPVSIRS